MGRCEQKMCSDRHVAPESTNFLQRLYLARGLLYFSVHLQELHFFLKYILLITLLQLSHFFSFYSPPPCTLLAPAHPPSCPWVIHISSLASPFPTLFLTFPSLFCTYHLCFLFPAPFPPSSPLSLPTDNPPCDLHFCGSVPVLAVCLVCFCFCFRGGC